MKTTIIIDEFGDRVFSGDLAEIEVEESEVDDE